MTITARELLDTSIGQLRTLTAFLSDQLGEGGSTGGVWSATGDIRACNEVLVSLGVLISKLEVAHSVTQGPYAPSPVSKR